MPTGDHPWVLATGLAPELQRSGCHRGSIPEPMIRRLEVPEKERALGLLPRHQSPVPREPDESRRIYDEETGPVPSPGFGILAPPRIAKECACEFEAIESPFSRIPGTAPSLAPGCALISAPVSENP